MKQRAAKIPLPGQSRLSNALERLVQLDEAMGKKDEVTKWQAERAKCPEPAPRPLEKK